ncbi:CLUMA_CG008645, isoform A [Clunio marinus]|uniref:CLUMA_CG008645, isoform A n=1 Tax=Clunio marinus TaxID=568069 RepID=A0A1J1I736_9DIPT|nr:CLUMA_CG008645, isoform A [Clunio marinus]
MTTLIPTSQSQHQQSTATTVGATPAGVESYEDMFKEITRKLYGDESAHGLYPINNAQVAQLAQTPSAPPEGERSFTTLVSDRSLAQLEYENVMPAEISTGNFKSEEHLSTAFGLAALMHNGFPPPTINFPPVAQEIIINTPASNTSNGGTNIKSENTQIQKRYNCLVCPYSTDRRDLFTRHENIHKEEKPFHCYACLKQFNRADHNSGATSGGGQSNVSATTHQNSTITIKNEKTSAQGKSNKIKGEKRFMCCYCPWSGADNWGLKRHLNTHTKPFVCLLCDYKAARSERLTTHIFKVHNKKACNKCNFFADDQAQLTQHQLDAHQNEVRNVRTTNSQTNNHNSSTTTPSLTVNNLSVGQPVASVVSNQSTTNVLRTLTNTFVPNVHHTPQTNHAFGSSNAPSSSLNNVTSSIYTTSNVNTNLVEQLNHHLTSSSNNWRTVNSTNNSLSNLNLTNINGSNRIQTSTNSLILTPTTTTTTTSLKRKSGAERLFAYFEADDSDDIELDYARQLQMQALSRNTASVAQDFRSAGGEQIRILNIKGNHIAFNNLYRDGIDTNGAIGIQQEQHEQQQENQQQQKKKFKATSPIDHSPPAVTMKTVGLPFDSFKRRRKMSPFNDKENVNELLTKQLTFLKQQHMIFLKNLNESVMSDSERLKIVQEINEIFETMYNNSMYLISSIEGDKRMKVQQSANDDRNGDEKFSLPAFLTNNNEITVIMEPKNHDRDQCEIRKNRKQLKPKKIEYILEDDINNKRSASGKHEGATRCVISDLRDKHMVRLVTRRKYCSVCRNRSSYANTIFNKTSLLLHMLWRHSTHRYECHQCQMKFNQIYKLKLHKKLRKH